MRCSITTVHAFVSNCPHASAHGSSYSPDYHLDQQLSTDTKIGEFNGLYIAPANFNVASDDYAIEVTFNVLDGVADADDLCIAVVATDVAGHSTSAWSSNCPS